MEKNKKNAVKNSNIKTVTVKGKKSILSDSDKLLDVFRMREIPTYSEKNRDKADKIIYSQPDGGKKIREKLDEIGNKLGGDYYRKHKSMDAKVESKIDLLRMALQDARDETDGLKERSKWVKGYIADNEKHQHNVSKLVSKEKKIMKQIDKGHTISKSPIKQKTPILNVKRKK